MGEPSVMAIAKRVVEHLNNMIEESIGVLKTFVKEEMKRKLETQSNKLEELLTINKDYINACVEEKLVRAGWCDPDWSVSPTGSEDFSAGVGYNDDDDNPDYFEEDEEDEEDEGSEVYEGDDENCEEL
jgi:hypothetical protein